MNKVFPNNTIFLLNLTQQKMKIVLFSLSFLLFLPTSLAFATTVTTNLSNSTYALSDYYDYSINILSSNNPHNTSPTNFLANKKTNSDDLNENEEMQQIWKNYRKLTINDDCMLCKKLKAQQTQTDIVKIERFTTLNKESPLIEKNIDNIAKIITHESNNLTNFFKNKHVNGQIIVAFTFLTFPESIKKRVPIDLKPNIQCEQNQCALDYIEILKTNIDNKLIKDYNTLIVNEAPSKYLFLNNIKSPTYFKVIICWKIENQ